MSDGVNLEIQYSVDDYVRGLTFIQNRQFIFRYGFIVIPFVLVIFLLISVLLNVETIDQLSLYYAIITFAPILAIFVIFLLLKYLPNPFLVWNVRKQFKTSPVLQEKQQISIDETGIKGKSDLSAGETKWPAIIEAYETKDDFYFFTSNKYAMFIPKNDLTIEQKNKIRELAKRNLREKAKFYS